ncbi:MAG: extracellular solute-binding protein [Lachnospiraceae bacterium]|nr:extracellular solute-binding protein [Lachnospiraceae bacterium]
MKKRILATLLTTLMVASLALSGCSGKQPTMDGSNAPDAAPAAEAPAAEAPADAAEAPAPASGDDKTITFWNIATDEPDHTLYIWAVDKYNAETSPESGYTVEMVPTVNDQYKEKLAVAMGAGQCPDMYTNWTGGSLVEYAKSGLAQDVTDLVDKYGLRDRYTEASLAQASIDGKIYAIPVKSNSVASFFYDKKMWAEKGYEIPKTLDELEALCDKMVADGITPFALANQPQWTGSMYYMYLVARHGGPEIISKAYDGTGSLENESTIFAGEKIEEWVDKGYFPEGVNSLSPDNGDDRALLYKGAGMMLHGSWQVSSIKSENPDFYENLGAFPFPEITGSSADQTAVVGTLGDNFISFSCTGEKLEEAFKLATLYSTDEFMQMDIDSGNLPPLKAAKSDEPAWQDILAVLNSASSVQLWWDQYLPPAVADVHKSATQKLFDKSETPENVAKEQQAAMDEWLSQQ